MRNRSDAIRARPRWYVCKECGRHRLAGRLGDEHGCSQAQEKRTKVAKQRKFTSEVLDQRNDGEGLLGTNVAAAAERAADKKG